MSLTEKLRLGLITVAVTSLLLVPVIAFADPPTEKKDSKPSIGLLDVGTHSGESGVARVSGLSTLTGNIINSVLGLVGVVFFVLMIYAGFLWMTARGNEEQFGKAKNIFATSIIGMLIVIGAYYILDFVFEAIYTGIGADTGTD